MLAYLINTAYVLECHGLEQPNVLVHLGFRLSKEEMKNCEQDILNERECGGWWLGLVFICVLFW